MLKTLTIENVAVIEYTEINFTDGLNVLTGETGAGKSMLIDSLNAVLGARTSKDIIRNGTDAADINAYFEDINLSAVNKLNELGFQCENNSVLLERKITADGKSTARINGKITVASVLRELAEYLIDIHGQHDNQKIMNSDTHYKFVDSYAQNEKIYNEYLQAYRRFCDLKNQFDRLLASEEQSEERAEKLRFEINELSAAEIKAGEIDALRQKRNLFANNESIYKDLQIAVNSLSDDNGSDTSAVMLIGNADRALIDAARLYDKLSPLSARLTSLLADAQDICEELKSELDDINFDFEQKSAVEERLALLSELSRKYGQSEEAMLDRLNDSIREFKAIVNSEEALSELEEKLGKAQDELIAAAEKLTESRKTAAKSMAEKIADELSFLDMPGVKFEVLIIQDKYTKKGCDNVEFMISTNPGEPPKSMSKTASGGELSRIMLALKNVLTSPEDTDTMIFDEIDTGISGKAAAKVGEKLKQTASKSQVICVTHLAQIAAKADSHFLIKKSTDGERTFTKVTLLDFEGRKCEIARIIGGDITEQNLLTAEEMLVKS